MRRCRRQVAGVLGFLLTVSATGCAELMSRSASQGAPRDAPGARSTEMAAPPVTPDVPPPEPQRLPLTPEEAAEVESLLARAERAIAEDHLTYPSQGSALALYDRVRILDPANEEARRGLERIVERYLEMATMASERGRFTHARAMLDRARLVDPRHPGIDPTHAQISMLTAAERRVIRLDGQRLRDQDPGLGDTLRQAGVASRGDGCRAQIVARSDSEGRWIYQQMSGDPGDARIRAQLDIGSPPRIEVLCFPASQ